MFNNYSEYEKAPLAERLKFWEEVSWDRRMALDGNTTITKYNMLNDLSQVCLEAREALASLTYFQYPSKRHRKRQTMLVQLELIRASQGSEDGCPIAIDPNEVSAVIPLYAGDVPRADAAQVVTKYGGQYPVRGSTETIIKLLRQVQ